MHGKLDSGAEKAGEAGETDGCRGECASNRDRGTIAVLILCARVAGLPISMV